MIRQKLYRISIHVPLAGDDAVEAPVHRIHIISIHVPLAGDDHSPSTDHFASLISIHVPLAGDDYGWKEARRQPGNFYPRPPCGGRLRISSRFSRMVNFYPRPPCGGRRDRAYQGSISWRFLSTSPLRGTTERLGQLRRVLHISIHVPLARDDCAGGRFER